MSIERKYELHVTTLCENKEVTDEQMIRDFYEENSLTELQDTYFAKMHYIGNTIETQVILKMIHEKMYTTK